MNECYVCGIGEDKSVLYEGVSKEGFVYVCRKCYVKNEIPLVEKKNVTPELENKRSVRERLSSMAGLKKDYMKKEEKIKPEDDSLKKIVERNFKENLSKNKIYDDLIENFHWLIMRKRRSMKLTQEQFANLLFEPVIVVEHAERGQLPKDYYGLMKKIEGVLKISLFKKMSGGFEPSRIIGETKVASGVMISDLKRYQEQNSLKSKDLSEDDREIEVERLDLTKVEETFGTPIESPKKERRWSLFGKKKKASEEDISQEDIDKIIFGRDNE
ncbi:MAG: hypothetical protein KC516_03000 [Nanoarchaeota archaeon]|nr:hypothetical protein [Nanoarchaeota archaeon]